MHIASILCKEWYSAAMGNGDLLKQWGCTSVFTHDVVAFCGLLPPRSASQQNNID